MENIHPSEDGEALRETGNRGAEPTWYSALGQFCEPPDPAKWYALHTASRHEKRVAQHLVQRQIDCYLPLYSSERKWSDGSRVTLNLPLFPGYLFIRALRCERSCALAVPGALALVGGAGGQPAPLPDSTINALRTGLQLLDAQPHPLLTVGQRVRIRAGALAGLEGIVVRSKSSCRIVLTLEHIMRSYAVEVGVDDLEPLAPMNMRRAVISQMAFNGAAGD